ncbi:hypothetical protein Pcinc_036275, partial [Petrolisthes cinctipes]
MSNISFHPRAFSPRSRLSPAPFVTRHSEEQDEPANLFPAVCGGVSGGD